MYNIEIFKFFQNYQNLKDIDGFSTLFATLYTRILKNSSCETIGTNSELIEEKYKQLISVDSVSTLNIKFFSPINEHQKYCFFGKLTIVTPSNQVNIIPGEYSEEIYITNITGKITIEILTNYKENFTFFTWKVYNYEKICPKNKQLINQVSTIHGGSDIPHSLCCFNVNFHGEGNYGLLITKISLHNHGKIEKFVQVNGINIFPSPQTILLNNQANICTSSAMFKMIVCKFNYTLNEQIFLGSNEKICINSILSLNVTGQIERRILIRTKIKHIISLTKLKSSNGTMLFYDRYTPYQKKLPLTNNTSYLHEAEITMVEQVGNNLDNFSIVVESKSDNNFDQKSRGVFNISVGNCKEKPCRETRECQNNSAFSSCNCSPGYFGLLCTWSYCENKPCYNNGNCTATNDKVVGFMCKCPSQYFGKKCEDNAKSCRRKRCSNGGSCKGEDSCICDNGKKGRYCDQKTDIRKQEKDPFVKLLQEPFWFGIVVVLMLSLAAASSFALRRKCSKQADKVRKKIVKYWRSRSSKNFDEENNPEPSTSKRPSFENWDRYSALSEEVASPHVFPRVINLLQSWQDSVEEIPQPSAEQRRMDFVDAVRRSRMPRVSTFDSCDSSSIESRRRKRKRSHRRHKPDCSSTDTADSRKFRRRKKRTANRKLVPQKVSLDSNNESTTSGFASDRLAEVDNKPFERMLSMIADEEEQQNKNIFYISDQPVAIYGERVTEL